MNSKDEIRKLTGWSKHKVDIYIQLMAEAVTEYMAQETADDTGLSVEQCKSLNDLLHGTWTFEEAKRSVRGTD